MTKYEELSLKGTAVVSRKETQPKAKAIPISVHNNNKANNLTLLIEAFQWVIILFYRIYTKQVRILLSINYRQLNKNIEQQQKTTLKSSIFQIFGNISYDQLQVLVGQFEIMLGEKSVENQLSQQYFSKCPELTVIQEPFDIQNIQTQLESRDFQTEFELIRALTQTKRHKNKLRINSIIENKKNRYPQQSIFQKSRVILPFRDEEQSTYINANWINIHPTKQIIITQGPLQTTQQDFQLMIRHQKIDCVIMLCNIIEGGKIRCFDYIGNRQKEIIQEIDNYVTISKIFIPQNQQNQRWTYTHIHYSEWPDRKVPEHPEHIKTILKQAMKFDRIAIHCSAGLGRSGVLASALLLQLGIKQGKKVSVFGTVRRLREYRFGSVQNSEQYKFIYDYLREILHSRQ